ncbi:MAG: hypothetical protein LQ348_005406 [Seirophora lacunosa]|nr:MAG: hypothetical protein LQ348_005406 [Seirophora lacunosa]
MTDSTIYRKEFAARELATQAITLYPTRAHVVRSIKDLSLKPGFNEITIHGITPTTDESSIKVEGTGAATITDMTIDLVDNREQFGDVYPSDIEDGETSESDSSSESDDEPEAVKDLTSQIRKLELSMKDATEQRNSAQGRLDMLDNYARSLSTSRPDDITACVDAYQTERFKAFQSHKEGEIKLKEHEQQINKLKVKKHKLVQKEKERKRKANQVRSRDNKKKEREKQQKMDEKTRLKQERTRFWPRKVYQVILCLDANLGITPASSRRGSIDSLAKTSRGSHHENQSKADTGSAESCTIDLSFSYITYSASWSPRYDLSVETSSKSGSITYRAEFRNSTSETWRETKVVLSTSQTSFQGLGEPIPQIQPWHIRLAKGFGDHATQDALFSPSEQLGRKNHVGIFGQKPQPPRNQLFGGNVGDNPFSRSSALPTQGLFGSSRPAPPPSGGDAAGGLFGSSRPAPAPSGGAAASSIFSQGAGIFGGSTTTERHAQPQATTGTHGHQGFGALQVQPNIALPQHLHIADEDEGDLDTKTIAPTEAALAFEESTWEESGLTTAYTVPGLKTIAPSTTTRRHKVASIPLSSITLSHIIVPKLRTAAFLKARLRNTSSTTLLKGPVGLTLDGTFLGNTTLPRSSPGEAFVLNLGVDPTLHVVYGKPTVRRSQTGVFQKEGSRIYTRSCTLTNTKNNAVVDATVLDQVPMSQDEKLKVEVLIPRGLRREEDQAVKAGLGQVNEGTGKKGSTYAEQEGGEGKVKWGKATAKMKKEGEVEWDVKLNPGQGVKLELEYEARFPGGEGIVGV